MNENVTTTKEQPPARFSERAFRRFEKDIFAAVTTHPNVVIIETKTPNATACGFRNAMKSLYHCQWETTVPHNLFLKLYAAKDIVTRELPGKVVIGSRQTTKQFNPQMSGSIIEPNRRAAADEQRFYVDCKQNTAWVVCSLSHNRLLTQPVTLRGLSVETATELSQSFDVLLEPVAGCEGDWLLT